MHRAGFEPRIIEADRPFFRDGLDGRVYHRVFHRVLYADTDRSGVVYHANYLRYFELGRASLMRELGFPYKQVEESGYMYPVVDLGVRYEHPLGYDNPMWIFTCPAELERVKVRFEYVIQHGESGRVVCRGHTLHCAVDSRGRPRAVDPITVKTFSGFPDGQVRGSAQP